MRLRRTSQWTSWAWARGRAGLTLVAVATLTAACGKGAVAFDSDEIKSADDRADRAGTVMDRELDGNAIDMVRRVVGGDPARSSAIEALVADGDRFKGRIVLRITENNPDDQFGDVVVRCYEYQLRNSVENGKPRHLDCPDLPVLTIPDAAP
jgi:hypothetical protein